MKSPLGLFINILFSVSSRKNAALFWIVANTFATSLAFGFPWGIMKETKSSSLLLITSFFFWLDARVQATD
ncbi:hypothetical protein [Gibbsiella quercinecans]|uniref:hypothetical protein n=1 Tax=Gibbsiella quercinecans TaxID=929813 RepID=UPI003A4D1D15